MLSRLALKQSRGLLARQPIRSLATAVPSTGSKYVDPVTHISTLSNGLTVATESQPHAQTATVGVWVDAGSRVDGSKASGSAHFLEVRGGGISFFFFRQWDWEKTVMGLGQRP